MSGNSETASLTMKMNRTHRWLFSAFLTLCAPGCGHRYLAETPNLLLKQDPAQVYASCPANYQTPDVPVIYATDRAILSGDAKNPTYGHGRANTLAFGVANVSLNPHPTWKELIQDSTRPKRSKDYELKLAAVTAKGEIKPHLEQVLVTERGLEINKAVAEEIVLQRSQLYDLLESRLAQSKRKDVYIYVHGVNNTFEDGVFRSAELWHFMGRVGVPIAYTWPAGLGGLRGYAYDRESGEFTVSHFRHFVKTVAECPDVERVHLIAHSRGSDVVVSALRELHLSYLAQGKSTQKELKLENLVLAAPDIDEDVFMQRFVAENLLQAAKRTTIYASKYDRAIEAADLLFASRQRLGSLAVKDFSPKVRQALAKRPNVQFIECKLTSGWSINHDYVFSNPAALSDVILVLRDGCPPGAQFGRPLSQPAEGIWELDEDYLAKTK
jgi:esterase/lipase superfamily enzyme